MDENSHPKSFLSLPARDRLVGTGLSLCCRLWQRATNKPLVDFRETWLQTGFVPCFWLRAVRFSSFFPWHIVVSTLSVTLRDYTDLMLQQRPLFYMIQDQLHTGGLGAGTDVENRKFPA